MQKKTDRIQLECQEYIKQFDITGKRENEQILFTLRYDKRN